MSLAQRIADRLIVIDGIAAVTLGGSHARGTATASSDLDLGLLYQPDNPIDLAALRSLAADLDDDGDAATVTNPGAWGPWINGGAWLVIAGTRVDWLFRDLGRIRQVLAECQAGRPVTVRQAGHPFGFVSPILLGEIAYAIPLADPTGVVADLKRQVLPYPVALRRALIDQFSFEATFALVTARSAAAKGDTVTVAGDLFVAAMALVQLLFAHDGRYCLNEKGALAETGGFAVVPPAFAERVATILAAPGATPADLLASIDALDRIGREVRQLIEAA